MQSKPLITRVRAYADNHSSKSYVVPTGLGGLMVMLSEQPVPLHSIVYKPLVCLVLQGRKETHSGNHAVTFGAGESLIVSHQSPVLSKVTEASPDKPYVALVLELDMQIIGSLYNELSDSDLDTEHARSLSTGETDEALLDAFARLFALLEHPLDAKVLLPLVLREIHFRLLSARHGATLRRLLQRGSHAERIAKAIALIQRDLSRRCSIAELANAAGMSPSSFHEHFKLVMNVTPLKYQQELRLLEARRLLREGTHKVSAAAYAVGYESPPQFSREYSRKFGSPPSVEIRR